MDKRTIWTIIVTAVIVFLYQYLFIRPYYDAQQAGQEQVVALDPPVITETSSATAGQTGSELPPIATDQVTPEETTASVATAVGPVSGPSISLPLAGGYLKTPELELSWENRLGGVLTGARLAGFRHQYQRDESVELIPVPDRSSALTTFWGSNAVPGMAELIDNSDNRLVYRNQPLGEEAGLVVTTELTAISPFRLKVLYLLHNTSTVPLKLDGIAISDEGEGRKGSFGIGWGPTLGDTTPDRSGLNEVKISYMLGNSIEDITGQRKGGFLSALFGKTEEEVTEKTEIVAGNISWSAIANRYFLAAILSNEPCAGLKTVERGSELSFSMIAPEIQLAPGGQQTIEYTLYLGPKDYNLLESQGSQLEKTINFGWFDWLGVLLLSLMKKFYEYIPNFGVAIILVTVVVRLIMYPLTYKSYASMKKMQTLQPKIEELRKKFPKSPEKQQEEIMKLYKTEKINPLMGCLPMLLQLPIFIALFRMLEYAIELRHQPFIWWITDLSQPDTIGMFPEWLPLFGGAALNVLPFIMGFTMFLQQKRGMTGINPQQEKIMLFMPVMLTFMLYSFPAGLMLYWSMSNLFGLGQQWLMTKKLDSASTTPPKRKT